MVFDKKYDNTSVFSPENLLREARRQKSLNYFEVPKICVLDPDGDIVKCPVRIGVGNDDDKLERKELIGTASKVENKLLGTAVGVEDEAADMLARTELIGTAGKVEKRLLGTADGGVSVTPE